MKKVGVPPYQEVGKPLKSEGDGVDPTWYLEFFGRKNQFIYISLKIGKISNYDIIVKSYTGCLYFLVCMERGDP